MKKITLTCFVLYFFSLGLISQVGINTLIPNAKAILDLTSTSKGLLPPRMTEAQRNTIGSPVPAGLMVWCIDCGNSGQMQVFNGTVWTDMIGGPASSFICGTTSVTFTYNGSPVTYGTVASAGGKCWLDRNLGASQVATSSTDEAAYGDLFQWGRGADGHQIRNPLSDITTTLSSSDQPANGSFILANDWRSPLNDNLWQGVNGINNPCPSGYRLPTEIELNTELTSWSSNNPAGAFASPLKLPVAGGRFNTSGLLNDVGTYGYYWSSTVDGTNARRLFFYGGDAGLRTSPRASGRSVRCIKD